MRTMLSALLICLFYRCHKTPQRSTATAYEHRSCPNASRTSDRRSLRFVTQLDAEEDVEIVFSQEVQTNRALRCRSSVDDPHCPNCQALCNCDYRRYIARINCGFVDSDWTTRDGPGEVFDATRIFPMHPLGWELKGPVPEPVVEFPQLANGLLSVYGSHFAHFSTEILPGLIFFLRHLPENVPILVDLRGVGKRWTELLVERGLASEDRWVPWSPNTTYRAQSLYFQAVQFKEKSRQNLVPGPMLEWQLLRTEIPCSWRPSLMNYLVREAFSAMTNKPCMKPQILILYRNETQARRAINHESVVSSCRQHFPAHSVREFVGADLSIQESIRIFQETQVFVTPHGAGLAYMQFLQAGAAVIEIGYDQGSSIPWPAGYYEGNSLSLSLHYFYSVAQGDHHTPIHINVDELTWSLHQAVKVSTPAVTCNFKSALP